VEGWSADAMSVELGHFALVLALAVAIYQTIVPLYGAYVRDTRWMMAGNIAALLQLTLIVIAYAVLTKAYLVSDFSVLNVAENSHSAKPLMYKIAGVWGNHEGSMLLWVMILALFGSTVALFGQNLPDTFRARAIAVQGAIGSAFILFVVASSNPFTRLDNPPLEGNGLNPILQDPALAFHPPFLYAGYVGLSIAFSFAVAALIEGKVDSAWARWVRPWTLASWAFLTIGIAMGSWWAYYELGWGGFWFWDPVENASFMPWLVSTALLHSAIVVEKRNALKIWTILLAILAFSLSLVGTFLVRSGVLTSVHAFAVDPERGLYILAILVVFIGGALSLFAWRAPTLKQGGLFAPVSRETSLVINNLLLCVSCAAVLIGTLAPLVIDNLFGTKQSFGAPYFNLTFGPIFLALLLLVPLGPMLAWKRADLLGTLQRLWWAAALALALTVMTLAITQRGPWLAPVGLLVGFWLILGSLADMVERSAFGRVPFRIAFSRLAGLPRSAHGGALAHAGLGAIVIGVLVLSLWKQEAILVVKPGETIKLASYDITFLDETPLTGPNYRGVSGRFRVMKGDSKIATPVSEKRLFNPGNMPTTEVGLHHALTGDLYIVMGDKDETGGRVVRAYFNPMASLIWLGAAVMFAGGFLSLTDRRFRIGVPTVAKPKLSKA
jgi:cytochrome c-type biogenesis protein CcmF